MARMRLSNERLRNLVDGLIEDSERDARGGVLEVDDVEVPEAVVTIYRTETWSKPGRLA